MQAIQKLAMAAAIIAIAGAAATAQAATPVNPPIKVDIYSGFVESAGSGITFSGFVEQQTAFEINFLPSAQWFPLGTGNSFGAQLTSGLNAPSAGNYTLTMGSDDASYLFIDGALVHSLPGTHSYFTSSKTVTLSAGYHDMRLEFYNSLCCESRLTLDSGGLQYINAIPEPATTALWLGGLLATALAVRRRRGA